MRKYGAGSPADNGHLSGNLVRSAAGVLLIEGKERYTSAGSVAVRSTSQSKVSSPVGLTGCEESRSSH